MGVVHVLADHVAGGGEGGRGVGQEWQEWQALGKDSFRMGEVEKGGGLVQDGK